MGFYVHWTPPHNTTVMCFDLPEKVQASIKLALESSLDSIDYKDPYSLFSIITGQIIALYDTSVWSLRNHICNWEAVCYQDLLFDVIKARLTKYSSIATMTQIIRYSTKLQGIPFMSVKH